MSPAKTRLEELVWENGMLGPYSLGMTSVDLARFSNDGGAITDLDEDSGFYWEIWHLGLSFQMVDDIAVSISARRCFYYMGKNLVGLPSAVALSVLGNVVKSDGEVILETASGITIYVFDDVVTVVHVENYDLIEN
jgi:hypothetical protein